MKNSVLFFLGQLSAYTGLGYAVNMGWPFVMFLSLLYLLAVNGIWFKISMVIFLITSKGKIGSLFDSGESLELQKAISRASICLLMFPITGFLILLLLHYFVGFSSCFLWFPVLNMIFAILGAFLAKKGIVVPITLSQSSYPLH